MRFEWPKCTRCCCCLPLRRGVITIGYLNIITSILIVISLSIYLHNKPVRPSDFTYRGVSSTSIVPEVTLTLYVLELVFNAVLLYGAHMKIAKYVKAYFYYSVTTTATCVMGQILEFVVSDIRWYILEIMCFAFIGLCLQIYLLTLTWNLIKKLERSGPHYFDNQLNQIIVGSGDQQSIEQSQPIREDKDLNKFTV